MGLIVEEPPPKNLLMSGPQEMETFERPALESANRAGEHPGGAFCGQLVPLEW